MDEEISLIVAIGRWILGYACRQLRRWQHDSGRPLSISINLAAVQRSDDGPVGLVAQTLNETGILDGTLKLELTENPGMADSERTLRLFRH